MRPARPSRRSRARWRRRPTGAPPPRRSGRSARSAVATASAAAGRCRDGRSSRPRPSVRYSTSASVSQPTSVEMSAITPDRQEPATEHQAEQQREHPERPEERTPRRPGHVDAGRRPVVDDRRQRSWLVSPMSCRRCAAPRPASRAASGQGDHAEDERHATEHQAEEQQEQARPPRRPARTTARACGCRVASRAGCAACRGAAAARSPGGGRATAGRRRRGRRSGPAGSAMSTPQSGMTNCGDQLEDAGPEFFEHRSSRSGRAAGGDRDHSSDEPATST